MIGHTEYPQLQNPWQWGQPPQSWGAVNPQFLQTHAQSLGGFGQPGPSFGPGQAAFGQAGYGTPFGNYGIGPWGQGPGWGSQ